MQPEEDPRLWNYMQEMTWNSLRYGPVPVPEAIARMRQDDRVANSAIERGLAAPLVAMQGDFASARALAAEMRTYLLDRGMTLRSRLYVQ